MHIETMQWSAEIKQIVEALNQSEHQKIIGVKIAVLIHKPASG